MRCLVSNVCGVLTGFIKSQSKYLPSWGRPSGGSLVTSLVTEHAMTRASAHHYSSSNLDKVNKLSLHLVEIVISQDKLVAARYMTPSQKSNKDLGGDRVAQLMTKFC